MPNSGGFGAFAVTNAIRKDEEVFRNVEQPTWNEEHISEHWVQQRMRIAAGTVEQEHRIVDLPGRIAMGRTQGVGKCLARSEAKIRQDDHAVFRGPGSCLAGSRERPTCGGR